MPLQNSVPPDCEVIQRSSFTASRSQAKVWGVEGEPARKTFSKVETSQMSFGTMPWRRIVST